MARVVGSGPLAEIPVCSCRECIVQWGSGADSHMHRVGVFGVEAARLFVYRR